MKNNSLDTISKLITEAKNIAICTSSDKQSFNAGVAMALFMSEKFSKKASLVYTGDISEIESSFFDIVEIKDSFATKSLKITIDYSDSGISAVGWEKVDDTKLVLELKEINRNFDKAKIIMEEVGEDVDLIFTLGIADLQGLGDFYQKNKADFDSAEIINLDVNENNKKYGSINYVYSESDSIISLVLRKFADWKYTPSAQISTVLLYGLQKHFISEMGDDVSVEQSASESSKLKE